MKFEKEIESLKNFNQTLEQLQSFNFWKRFPANSGINITFENKAEGGTIGSKIIGPDDEAISAYILKYRLFIQDKDDISLRNMDKLYSELQLEKKYYDQYKNYRQRINDILDRPSNVEINKHRVTIREIHNMFIYGYWAHMDQSDLNRKRFLGVKNNPVLYPIFTNDFNVTLIRIMNELVQIKFLNENVIK